MFIRLIWTSALDRLQLIFLCYFRTRLITAVLAQTTDMYVYTFNHTKDGWFCPGWGGEGSTIDTVSA